MLLAAFVIPGVVGFLADKSGEVYELFNIGFQRLKYYWNYLHDKVWAFFTFVSVSLLQSLFSYFTQLVNLAGYMYNSLSLYVSTLAATVWTIVHVMFPALTSLVYSLYNNLVTLAGQLFSRILHLTVNLFSSVVSLAVDMFSFIFVLVKLLYQQITSLAGSLYHLITTLATTLFSAISLLATTFFNPLIQLASTFFHTITSFFTSVLFGQLKTLANYVVPIVDFFNRFYGLSAFVFTDGVNLLNWLKGNWGKLSTIFDGALFGVLADLLSRPDEFIKSRISAAFKDIKDWLIDEILDIIEQALVRYW